MAVEASIEAVPRRALAGQRDAIVAVYAAAFSEPPYREPPQTMQRFAASLGTHAARADFRMRVARVGGAVAGFAYGYESAPGQWWHERVADALGERAAARWLVGGFEVVELAVAPPHQGRGLGGRLHDALLDGVEAPTAVLSTLDAETPARALYRRRGWTPIGHLPSPTLGRFLVMGLDLRRRDPVGSAR